MGPASRHPNIDQLVSEHLPCALRFAVRLTGDLDAAEEVVQDALVRVAAGFESFRGEAQFRTWLFRIVINVFRTHCSRPRAARSLPAELADVRTAPPDTAAMADELGELIARRVSALPPRQREVLVLCVYENLSVTEVAQVLGITTANVHATLHVARQRLQAELSAYWVVK